MRKLHAALAAVFGILGLSVAVTVLLAALLFDTRSVVAEETVAVLVKVPSARNCTTTVPVAELDAGRAPGGDHCRTHPLPAVSVSSRR